MTEVRSRLAMQNTVLPSELLADIEATRIKFNSLKNGSDDHVSLHLTFGLKEAQQLHLFNTSHNEPSRLACSLAGWQDAR